MDATTENLSKMTVKTLISIAKDMGLKGYSKLNKADLVLTIFMEVNIVHGEALNMNASAPAVSLVIDTAEFPMDHAQFVSWFRRFADFEAADAINADHGEALNMNEGMKITPATPFKVSLMDYPAVDGRVVTEAHSKICAERGHVSYVKNGIDQGMCPRCGEVTTSEEQITEDEVKAAKSLSTEMISQARKAIKVLTPILDATKMAFENLRDNNGTDVQIDVAYQIFLDTDRAIAEYKRSIAYIAGDHDCVTWHAEIGLTDECQYGCKVYRCSKCQDEATLHNATYGCHQNN